MCSGEKENKCNFFLFIWYCLNIYSTHKGTKQKKSKGIIICGRRRRVKVNFMTNYVKMSSKIRDSVLVTTLEFHGGLLSWVELSFDANCFEFVFVI